MLLQTQGPLRSLLALMLPCLAKPRKEEKDERVISLGLHIVRNMLSIKDPIATSTTTGQKEEMSRLQVSPPEAGRTSKSLMADVARIVEPHPSAPQAHVSATHAHARFLCRQDRPKSVQHARARHFALGLPRGAAQRPDQGPVEGEDSIPYYYDRS